MSGRRLLLAVAAPAAALAVAAPSSATAPPVGKLPPGPVTSVRTTKGRLVAVAVPHVRGKSWRIARPIPPRVLREVSEADVGTSLVVIFRAVGRGRANVVLALTRGERPKAYRAVRYAVRVAGGGRS